MARKKKETTVTTDDALPMSAATTTETTTETPAEIATETPVATAVLESPAEPLLVAIPVETPAPAPTTAPPTASPTTSPPATNGQRRPAASWKFPAAGGVTIEVALWPHTITLQSGETVEVYNATITRSYKDGQGNWQKGGSYRIAELPVLRHAIEVAHAHALNARELNCPI